ncbi:MAG: FecR family protein [Chitinophagales bacterium]|nr:FecR family protein [Chitinophagales bacterium]
MDQGLRLQLLQLINEQEWTDGEKEWLLAFLQTDEADSLRIILYESFQQQLATPLTEEEHVLAEAMLQHIHVRLGFVKSRQQEPVISKRLIIYLSAVAAVLIFVIGFSLMYRHQESVPKSATAKVSKADVAPGGDKAVLTLADGTVVLLDDTKSDTLAKQGSLHIVQGDNGMLAYEQDQQSTISAQLYNTVATPRGGQYKILLSDGTQVWLNASSSIKFPVVFSNSERRVTITGEVYFDVAKSGKPFYVQVDERAEILVTGTKFNVNAYKEEAVIKTTLAEGKVQVRKQGVAQYQKLDVGEQAELSNDISINKQVDMDAVLAWINGKFDFGSEMDIQDVMRQVARWYDIEVVYEGEVHSKIGGSISRNVPASKVLEMIELTGTVHCSIEDKRVIVRSGSKKK